MGKLTFSGLNTHGRCGNNLFQIASSWALARRTERELVLPRCKYPEVFEWSPAIIEGFYPWIEPIKELYFQYCGKYFARELETTKECVNILGWMQTEKYFKDYEPEIRAILKWKDEFRIRLRELYKGIYEKPVIAIHVRRGDYVSNPNYHSLPDKYYIQALEKFFPQWMEKYNILVFSDDITWCKTYFNGANIYFSEGRTDLEDLCLMSQCNDFILSNSSFSWWGAWLSNTTGQIIRPTQYFEGELKKWNNTKDFWPPQWTEYNYKGAKINLMDVTFTIPVLYDHPDREANLTRIVHFLRKNFNTTIIVGEQGGKHFASGSGYKYTSFSLPTFHRTKMLNQMALEATTPIIVNYDADVIIPIIQLLQAVHLCRAGIGMVFPYDGRFARIPKHQQSLALHELNTDSLPGSQPGCTLSSGGCMMFLKDEYIKGGMENEHFISYGTEDTEIHERMGRVGVDVRRIKGPLYHYDHYIGPNSSPSNPHWERNCMELEAVRLMSNRRLKEYISTWKWLPK